FRPKRAATLHAGRQKRKPDGRTTDDVPSVVRNPSSASRRRAFAPGRKAAIKTLALAGHFDEQLRRLEPAAVFLLQRLAQLDEFLGSHRIDPRQRAARIGSKAEAQDG